MILAIMKNGLFMLKYQAENRPSKFPCQFRCRPQKIPLPDGSTGCIRDLDFAPFLVQEGQFLEVEKRFFPAIREFSPWS
jgi:hypothetical protein